MSRRPKNAITVWAQGDQLFAELPSPNGGKTHTITVEFSPIGFGRIVDFLKYRTDESQIGEKGDPTQFQLDKKPIYEEKRVRRVAPKVKPTTEQSHSVRSILRDMGLI